ncbi:MAG: metal ABC transporter permease, partial [Actinocrinis sp.]
GMAISVGIALASMWGGLALAYYAPSLPPSFSITAVAAGLYAIALLSRRLRRSRPSLAAS